MNDDSCFAGLWRLRIIIISVLQISETDTLCFVVDRL